MDALPLGPFAVDRHGTLQPRQPGRPPALRFAWRGRPCDAMLDHGALRIASLAARIPSTAEPGADRARAFAELAALPRSLPKGWRVSLLPDHRVRLEAEEVLEGPHTASALIAHLVRFALALDPYLDRLEAAGVTIPRSRAA